MYRLSRVHFDSIGHPEARFDPLTLDFRGGIGQSPLDTVLWLRNMGGKTSMLALIFSVLQPRQNDFLGRERAGEIRQLQKYVLPDDVAHVVIEWWAGDQGSLPGFERNTTLVTGLIMTQRKGISGEFDRVFYSFRSMQGVLDLDSLVFRKEGQRVPLRTFLDQLTKAHQSNPSLELCITEKQIDWKENLESLRLDPEVFRYQLRMNEHEAGARKFLSFRDADGFVDFLIEVVTDPAAVNQVAENLAQVSDKLALKPAREKEREFAAGIAGRLRPILIASENQRNAETEHQRVVKEAALLSCVISRSAAEAQEEEQRLKEEAVRQRDLQQSADSERSRLERQVRTLERARAELQITECNANLRAAQELEVECSNEVRAWQAFPLFHKQLTVSAAAHALEQTLALRLAEAEPDRAAYEIAATRLRARFRLLASEARKRAKEAKSRRALAENSRRRAREEEEQAIAAISRGEAELRALKDQLERLQARRRTLRDQGWIQHSESSADALHRLQAEDERSARRLSEISARNAELNARRTELTHLLGTVGPKIGQTAETINQREDERERLLTRAGRLSEEPRLHELAEHDELDVFVAGSLLVEQLLNAISQTGKRLVLEKVAATDDERARRWLEEERLLPPSLDVERAVTILRESKIQAVSGWHYLSEQLAACYWSQILESTPWLATAVIVPTGQADAAMEIFRKRAFDPAMLLTVAEQDEFHWVEVGDSPDLNLTRVRTHLTREALYDRAKAEIAREDVDRRLESSHQLEESLTSKRDEDERLLRAVSQLLEDCPPDCLERLEFEINELSREHRKCVEQQATITSQLANGDEELHLLVAQAEEAEERRRTLARAIPEIESLIEAEAEAEQCSLRERDLEVLQAEWGQRLEDARAAHQQAEDNQEHWFRACETANHEAAGWDENAEKIELFARDVTDDAAASLVELQAEYRRYKALYEKKTSQSEDAQRLRFISEQLSELQSELQPYEAVLSHVKELASDPALQSEGTRKTRSEFATNHLEKATEQRIRMETELVLAERQLSQLPTDPRNLTSLPPDLRPATVKQASDNITRLDSQRSQAHRARDQAEAAARAAEDREREARHQSELLSMEVSHLGDVLGDQLVPEDSPESKAITADEARSGVAGVVSRHQTTKAKVDEINARLEQELLELRSFASRSDFQDLAGIKRDRFSHLDTKSLATTAERDIAELELRIKWLDKELADLNLHRQTVALELVSLVEQAFQRLEDAQSMRLPEGLGDWTGNHYLRIKFQRPDSVEELKVRLQILIDTLVAQRIRPEGLSLLLKAVRAANRNEPFEATVLKPNEGLRLERSSVSEIVAWSGGQKLTTAILIYCVLIRLRSFNRKSRYALDNVLILDNPLGEANLISLVELQRRVAQALRIQLIFATGIDDRPVLAAFPNVIRLRNVSDRSSARRYLLIEPTNSTDGEGEVTAARIYRRAEAIAS